MHLYIVKCLFFFNLIYNLQVTINFAFSLEYNSPIYRKILSSFWKENETLTHNSWLLLIRYKSKDKKTWLKETLTSKLTIWFLAFTSCSRNVGISFLHPCKALKPIIHVLTKSISKWKKLFWVFRSLFFFTNYIMSRRM